MLEDILEKQAEGERNLVFWLGVGLLVIGYALGVFSCLLYNLVVGC